jgi:hypothetical protein
MSDSSTVTAPAPAAPAAAYEVRPGDARADADRVVRIWQEGGFIMGPGARARFDWFYLGNPAGAGHMNMLYSGGESIGFLGVGPRRFSVGGTDVPAGMLVDFVVRPDHRTAAPALLLQRAGRQRATESMQFIYGLPDTKAVMVFKRLGADVKFDLPTFARVVRTKGFLARHLPVPLAVLAGAMFDAGDRTLIAARLLGSGLEGAWIERFDERFDRLWAQYAKQDACIGIRDRAFLDWRFGRQPDKRYRIFTVTRKGSRDLLAYFVCEVFDTVLNVKDCLSVGTQQEVTQALLLLRLAAHGLPVSVIHLQIAAHPAFLAALRAALFRQRSQRPFFAMLQPSVREQASKAVWYVTQADEDI